MSKRAAFIARVRSNPRLRKRLDGLVAALGVLFIAWFLQKHVAGHYYLSEILKPNAGEAAALPALVYQGIGLARAHHLQTVSLSSKLSQDSLTYQRFTEALYPIRVKVAAAFLLTGPDDAVAPSCHLVDERPLVRLMKCR